jgi:hypothetical protein
MIGARGGVQRTNISTPRHVRETGLMHREPNHEFFGRRLVRVQRVFDT